MEKDIFKKFNEKQYEAITTNQDSILVVAGAGSGKTSVLTHRIVYLVTELGYDPKKILGFTFTNKAANEMKTRISKLIKNANFPYIGTFHGICLRILREDINHLNIKNINSNFNIIDNEDQLSILKDIYNENNFNKTSLSLKNCLSYIMQLKNSEVDIEDVENELEHMINAYDFNMKKDIICTSYKKYLEYLQSNNLLDFDDLIKFCKKLLLSNNDVLKKWQNRFDYILVDEFQDTNVDQFDIISYLSKNKKNVFAVGDPDQMIYSWRGAYDDIFKEYIADFVNVKTIILERNYRSSKKILDSANKLIKNNSNRIEKNLYTESNIESEVVFYNAPNQDEESKYVVTKIQSLLNKGFKYKDFAILYRSNYLSRNIEQQLTFSSIPYKIYGGFKFYQRKEIKDILAYLKLINNNDEISLSRIYNIPKRGISEKSFSKIKEYAKIKNISTFDAFNHIENIDISQKTKNEIKQFYDLISQFKKTSYPSILNMVNDVFEKTHYKEMLIKTEEEHRIENIDELKNAIFQFESTRENCTLNEYLQEIALLTSADEDDSKDSNFVSLMTVHVAKGLEFKNVFIIEFNESIFPSQKAIDADGIEEERRIAYVAITRAKENLYICSSDGTSFYETNKFPKTPSRFFEELKNEHLSIHKNSYVPIGESKITLFDSSKYETKVDLNQYCHDFEVNFNIGDWIVHKTFGEGVILDVDDKTVKIAFKLKSVGTKIILKNHKSLVRKLS